MPPHRPLPGSSTAGPPTPHCVHGRAGRPPAPSAAPPGCGHVGPWSVWWEALSSAHRQAPTVRPCGEKWGESLAAAPRPAGWGWGGRGSPLLVPPASRSPGLVGVVCPGPSWLVPSCSFRMCLTTAVALKACCQPHSVCHLAQGAPPAPPPPTTPTSPHRHPLLTFHLLFAKFFLICSLTDWWMFLSRAVSPAILWQERGESAGAHRAPQLPWSESGGAESGRFPPLTRDAAGLARR